MSVVELEHQIYREDALLAVFFHTGERAQAEFALDRCQHGHYHEGIEALEGVLRHGGFSMSNF